MRIKTAKMAKIRSIEDKIFEGSNMHLSACRGEGRKSDTPGLMAAV